MGLDTQDHGTLALWAANCAEHVLPHFEDTHPGDNRPRQAIQAGRAWAAGDLAMVEARRFAFAAHAAAREAEEYRRVTEVKGARGSRLPAGRAVPGGELRALVEACRRDPSPAGARDAAILAVLYIGGVRRAELVGLALADYTADPPTLRIRHGKGDKERLAPLTASAGAAITAWLARRGDHPGKLFLPVSQVGAVHGEGLSSIAIYNMLQKRAAQAGVAHVSPHDMRRSFVSDLLDAGVDLSAAQQLAGHASVVTTARYDRRGEASKRKAVETLHFPLPPQR